MNWRYDAETSPGHPIAVLTVHVLQAWWYVTMEENTSVEQKSEQKALPPR